VERILIIGCPGAGKTTFAGELSRKLGLPLVHLDKLYWCGPWEHLSREDFDTVLQPELEKPQWIIDGNYDRTLPRRLQYCDTVFFFDLPTRSCLWGITKRLLSNYGKSREDMGGDCPERFDKQKLGLYKNVLTFNRTHRKKYHRMLSDTKDVTIIVFRSRGQVSEFLKSLP